MMYTLTCNQFNIQYGTACFLAPPDRGEVRGKVGAQPLRLTDLNPGWKPHTLHSRVHCTRAQAVTDISHVEDV